MDIEQAMAYSIDTPGNPRRPGKDPIIVSGKLGKSLPMFISEGAGDRKGLDASSIRNANREKERGWCKGFL